MDQNVAAGALRIAAFLGQFLADRAVEQKVPRQHHVFRISRSIHQAKFKDPDGAGSVRAFLALRRFIRIGNVIDV